MFAAVVHRIIEDIRPRPDVPLIAGASLPDKLRHLAGLILKATLSPQAIALHRLVTGESSRFPELAAAVENDGGQAEATTLIAGLLSRELPKLKLSPQSQAFAAQQFIYMVVTMPQRRAIGFGALMTPHELDLWTANRPHVQDWWKQASAWPSFRSGLHDLIGAAEISDMRTYGPNIRDDVAAHLAGLQLDSAKPAGKSTA